LTLHFPDDRQATVRRPPRSPSALLIIGLCGDKVVFGGSPVEQDLAGLIPPPSVVREKLSRNYHQADLLRRLLKLSLAAARQEETAPAVHVPPPPRGNKC
jgi:hypothetical protein